MGAYVCLSPTTADSRAPNDASSKATSGSKLAPTPSGIGKTVRKPWIVSKAKRSGIPSRESSTAISWSSLIRAGSVTLRTEPSPASTSSSVTRKSGRSWICSSFSSSVILASRRFTRASTPLSAGPRVAWSASSSLGVSTATTLPATAVPNATVATATAVMSFELHIVSPFRANPD